MSGKIEDILILLTFLLMGISMILFTHRILAILNWSGWMLLKMFPWLILRDRNKPEDVRRKEFRNSMIYKFQLVWVRLFGVISVAFAAIGLVTVLLHM